MCGAFCPPHVFIKALVSRYGSSNVLNRRQHRTPSCRADMSPSKIKVLFINDTARNGGPGRSLYSILKFIDPAVMFRVVLLPRKGIINALLTGEASGVGAKAPLDE